MPQLGDLFRNGSSSMSAGSSGGPRDGLSPAHGVQIIMVELVKSARADAQFNGRAGGSKRLLTKVLHQMPNESGTMTPDELFVLFFILIEYPELPTAAPTGSGGPFGTSMDNSPPGRHPQNRKGKFNAQRESLTHGGKV